MSFEEQLPSRLVLGEFLASRGYSQINSLEDSDFYAKVENAGKESFKIIPGSELVLTTTNDQRVLNLSQAEVIDGNQKGLTELLDAGFTTSLLKYLGLKGSVSRYLQRP